MNLNIVFTPSDDKPYDVMHNPTSTRFSASVPFTDISELKQGESVHQTADDNAVGLIVTNHILLNVLNQSPCVTWILDLQTQKFSFISQNTNEFFGYESRHYLNNGHNFHESTINKEDVLTTWTLLHQVWKVLAAIPCANRPNYKFSHDYRISRPDGKEVRILEQNSVLQQDRTGKITHLLGVCNDITQWKKGGTQLASLSSARDKQCFIFNCGGMVPKSQTILSKRELEIVKLLSEGQSSKYIADKLFISFHTVNTHRQKMIEKTNTKNTGGLVQFAVCNGLI